MKLYSLVLFLAVSVISQPALADFRLATVDMNKVLNESKEAIAARKSLDAMTTKAQKEIDAKRDALKDVEAKLQSGKIKPDSPEADKYREDMRELSRFAKDIEDKLRREFGKSNTQLTQQTMAIVEKYAKANDIDMVLDKSSAPRGPVLFGAPSFDITEKVIAEMNG